MYTWTTQIPTLDVQSITINTNDIRLCCNVVELILQCRPLHLQCLPVLYFVNKSPNFCYRRLTSGTCLDTFYFTVYFQVGTIYRLLSTLLQE